MFPTLLIWHPWNYYYPPNWKQSGGVLLNSNKDLMDISLNETNPVTYTEGNNKLEERRMECIRMRELLCKIEIDYSE